MTDPEMAEDEYLDAQAAIYRHLGQVLYDMLDAEQQDVLHRMELLVKQNPLQGLRGQSFRVSYIPTQGPAEPLIARPAVIDLCRRLDTLARRRLAGSTWDSFTYVLSADEEGQTYECRYTYPVEKRSRC